MRFGKPLEQCNAANTGCISLQVGSPGMVRVTVIERAFNTGIHTRVVSPCFMRYIYSATYSTGVPSHSP